MIFVLCTRNQYGELYQGEAYKHIKLEDHTDLAGYAGINVYIHDGWYEDYNSEVVNYLEEQLVALADFGYIKLSYVDTEGHIDKYFPHEIAPTEDSQAVSGPTLYPSTPEGEKSSQSLTEEERMALIEQEDGCSSGACAI